MKRNGAIPFILLGLTLAACAGAPEGSSPQSTEPSSSEASSSAGSSVIDFGAPNTLSEAREAEAGTELTVAGIVTHFNYTGQGMPEICGFWLSDGTDTLYIYGAEAASSVQVGNTVKLKGTKAYYIPSTDTESAPVVNYKGQAQLIDPEILSNDGKTDGQVPDSVIHETTVEDLINTPLTEDISGKIYRVKGFWHVVPGGGWTNYELESLNRVDSLQAYTQCNGKDFSWTRQEDDKCVQMLIIMTLAKPTAGVWKFCPMEIEYETYVKSTEEAEYGAKRVLRTSLGTTYGEATEIRIPKEDPLVEGVTRSLSVVSGEGAAVTEEGDEIVLKIDPVNHGDGCVIKAEAAYKDATGSAQKEIQYVTKPSIETKTVAEARALSDGTEVSVEATVCRVTYQSGMAKQGMFLADETSSIFVYNSLANVPNLKNVEDGNNVIVTGKIAHYIKNADNAASENYAGDLQLTDVSVQYLDSGIHSIPEAAIDATKTIKDLVDTPVTEEITGLLYRVSGTVNVNSYGGYSLTDLSDTSKVLSLYSQVSGADFSDLLGSYTGQNVDLVIGIQNLNLKSSNSVWRACPIEVLGTV
jgi:uncharacterized protein YdeI (BOF family)